MITKLQVLEALKRVVDPEIGMNIVDVGLIYRVSIEGDAIDVDYTLTTKGCPLGDMIANSMVAALREEFPDANPTVNLVWDPPWKIDFMSEEGRLSLGYPI